MKKVFSPFGCTRPKYATLDVSIFRGNINSKVFGRSLSDVSCQRKYSYNTVLSYILDVQIKNIVIILHR